MWQVNLDRQRLLAPVDLCRTEVAPSRQHYRPDNERKDEIFVFLLVQIQNQRLDIKPRPTATLIVSPHMS